MQRYIKIWDPHLQFNDLPEFAMGVSNNTPLRPVVMHCLPIMQRDLVIGTVATMMDAKCNF